MRKSVFHVRTSFCAASFLALFFISARGFSQTGNSDPQSTNTPGVEINKNGELKIIPSAGSAKSDFDFLLGSHRVHHKKLKERLNHSNEWFEFDGSHDMNPMLDGLGNMEIHHLLSPDGKPVEGMALRLFNPVTRLWSIYWANSTNGTLEPPVVGSFDKDIGYFYGRDRFNGKDILVKFTWDKTDPQKPVWSQAFSPDNGKSWETNWYMYFSNAAMPQQADNIRRQTGVLELRNYKLRPGMRDEFMEYFRENFVKSQDDAGAQILGRFRVKGEEDNFFWLRGFTSMEKRKAYLPAFYYGPVWKRFGHRANDMLLNNDDVYLLKPLTSKDGQLITTAPVDSKILENEDGITVVDFLICNNKVDKMISFLSSNYLPLMKAKGFDKGTSFWVAELSKNDFPVLPVFQDKDLVVSISHYKNELEYQERSNLLKHDLTTTQQADLDDIVTKQFSLILYPAEK